MEITVLISVSYKKNGDKYQTLRDKIQTFGDKYQRLGDRFQTLTRQISNIIYNKTIEKGLRRQISNI